jgi:2-desacetyl-2-hydroxyethyl bacteriochlorophyllide A dehydrogenase
MKALVWEGPRQMNMRDMPDPEPGPAEVVIKTAYSGICGSELSGYLGENALRKPPLVMGHEFSGEIVDMGAQVTQYHPDLTVGQRVTVNPLMSCNRCRHCRSGRHNLCRQRQIVGIHQPGSYADLVKTHALTVHPLPVSVSLEHAALTEPLGCAIRAAKLAAPTPVDKVLIIGLGPIGLLALQAVRAFGVIEIFASETDADRRAMGEPFGVRVLSPLAEDVVSTVRSATDGWGVDVVIDAVGTTATRQQAIEAAAMGGRVVLVGLHEEASMMPANLVIRKEINLQGSFAYTPNDFVDALDWLAAGRIHIDPWLMKAPLKQGRDCFERLLSRPGPVAKILLY